MEQLVHDLDALHLNTMDDVSKSYDILQGQIQEYEDSCGDQSKLTFDQATRQLSAISQAIIQNSIFSPNEDFKDIQTENLKYLLLPYYMGEVFGRMTENRKKSLEHSKTYLNEYLKLLNHYGLIDDKLKKAWKNHETNPKYEPTREDKIAQYKEQKDLENKIKNLNKMKEESDQREAVKSYCILCIYKALDQLRSIKQEMEILEYMEKIKNDDQAKEEHEAIMKKPVPKLTSYNIPKTDNNLSYLMQQVQQRQDIQSHGNHEQLCGSCYGKSLEELRNEKKQEVWRPDISQPTVRLEELGDMYVRDMAKAEEMKKQRELEEQLAKGDNYDSDNENEYEKKRIEQTHWDNWKDENEKGAGNKGGR